MADEPGAVAVLNQALAHLGQEPVASLGEGDLDQSNAARKVLRQLGDARDTVLSQHGWTCALSFVVLTADATYVGTARWPARFVLPGDALRAWEVDGCGFETWSRSSRWLAASVDTSVGARKVIYGLSAAPLDIAYVRRASYAALDPHVRDAVAVEAAARGCWSVTGDQNRADKLAERSRDAALMAVSVDGTQEDAGAAEALSEFARLRRSCG